MANPPAPRSGHRRTIQEFPRCRNGGGTEKFHLFNNALYRPAARAARPGRRGWVALQCGPDPGISGPGKRCAAQAEYTRLAAQAYSPSDAMSQAEVGLDGMQKVQRLDANFAKRADPALKRRLAADVSVARAGWSSRFFPVVGDLAALPHAAGSFGLRARSSGLAAGVLAAAPAGAAGSTPDALDEAVATERGFGMARPA